MNKQAFINLIKSPEAISEKDLEALEELTGSFPFCQIAHTLIAKAHYNKSSMLVHQKIKKASAYSLNRALLKKAIVGDTAISTSFDTNRVGTAAKSNNTSTTDNAATPAQEKTLPADVVKEVSKPANSSVADEVMANIASLKESRKEYDSSLNSPEPSEVDNKNSNLVHIITVPETGSNLKEDFVRRPEIKTAAFATIKDKQFQNELIERFISSNPRLTPGFIEDKAISNDDLASESSKLNDTIVSENLAIIFTKQGKINKAKEIYKKLSLKYPEKAAYFAGKIDNLENK